ncbi:IclR family transcriptional regulator [Agromyces sp. Root81]|uniref:IclR family transcriptional regulator n=1 Tax=Agromyces sp. Root81 TaxID=1736601 RepID=UPI0006F9D700|nr:IclR family transcriptional regulator [Agromyces sp. Root81]KRC62124.1 IclR family transcriptional regulator [Agromyces sp. Root81]
MSQTVSRAMEIIRFIGPSPRSLGEIAEHIGVHKSTALRLLQTLEQDGFARHLPDGRHTVGFAIIPLAQYAIDQIDIRTLAHPFLQRLAAQQGHTVHLAQLMDDDVIYVDKVDGSGTVAMGSRIGLPAEGHTAGVAKVVLAHLPESVREEAIERLGFQRHTPTTIVTPGAFRRELDLVRQRGWAEDDGEKEDYINCVALPVFDASGRVTIGMSVTALRAVAPLAELREQMPEYRRVAQAISRELGWNGDEHERR